MIGLIDCQQINIKYTKRISCMIKENTPLRFAYFESNTIVVIDDSGI